jgi:hypothetical protein
MNDTRKKARLWHAASKAWTPHILLKYFEALTEGPKADEKCVEEKCVEEKVCGENVLDRLRPHDRGVTPRPLG